MIRSGSALATALLISIFGNSGVVAQTTPPPAAPNLPASASSPSRATPGAPSPAGPLLDIPVNRAEYVLGAGDVVNVSVFGDISFQESVEVSPEGVLVVPEIGITRVRGLNLNEAQDRVRDLVFRLYRNVDVSVTLSRVRSFRVFVLGDVPAPGVQSATAATRVSEVVPPTPEGIARRTIRVRRAAGDSIRVDLARFIQVGDLQANPILREGDAVIVPALDRTVGVRGQVAFPGQYEHVQGESLAALLSLANGGGDFPARAADTVRIARVTAAGAAREVIALSRLDATGAVGRALILEPFDAVYVAGLANVSEQPFVTISGQVVRPGVYPIRHDATTLREVVAMAGGFTPLASLTDASLDRPSAIRSPSVRTGGTGGTGAAPAGQSTTGASGASSASGGEQLDAIPEELLTQEDLQIRSILAAGGGTAVVTDFAALFNGDPRANDPVLRSGDVITVPRRRGEVTVLGAVTTPGLVAFTPGLSVEQYVARAGWFTRRAAHGDVVVITARGARMDPSELREIQPGDQIIVPFRDPNRVTRILSTTQGVVVTITGVVISVISAINLLN